MQAPPFDMGGECSDKPEEYLTYEKLRCADPKTNWLVFILLAIYCILTNCVLYFLMLHCTVLQYTRTLTGK